MRKIIFALAACLLLQSFAWADSGRGLRQIIDEYRYATTVEWDQRDTAVFEEMNRKFQDDLRSLGEVSAAELREALKGQGDIDPAVLEILKNEKGEVIQEKLQDLIDTRAGQMYASGSSWSPLGVFWAGAGILLVMEIVALVMRDGTCNNPGEPFPEDVEYDCIWSN